MSTSIHAAIEYREKDIHNIVWDFAEVSLGVSFSTIFARLGAKGHTYKPTVVPTRGFPMADKVHIDELSTSVTRQMTMLVDRHATDRVRESDGVCITQAEAERFLALKHGSSRILPGEYGSDSEGNLIESFQFYRIQNPDVHSVNWITASELDNAVNMTEKDGGGRLSPYRAAVAAMRILEADEGIEMVRFVYGFDN